MTHALVPDETSASAFMREFDTICAWTVEEIGDLAFLTRHFKHFHPANTGDIGILVPADVADHLKFVYSERSDWFDFASLWRLAEIRNDGRTGYRGEGVTVPEFYEISPLVAGRLLVISRTGAQLPALEHTIQAGQGGKLLTVIEIDGAGKRLRLVYGNHQHGSIPSIETHIHVAAAALNIRDGRVNGASVHAHPPILTRLGRHPKIAGNRENFNAALFTQIEGMIPNCPELVGVVQYQRSGSEALLRASLPMLSRHRALAWENHGFFVREATVRQCYVLMDYAEIAAQAALEFLDSGAVGLPDDHLLGFLAESNLAEAYLRLRNSAGTP
jgi:hypothetical protein